MAPKKTVKKPANAKARKGERQLSMDQPERWEPEVGDEVTGTVGPVRKGKFNNYRILRTPDVNYFLNGAGLDFIMDETALATGTTIRVVYLGEKETAYENPVKLYDVFVVGGESDNDDMPF